MAQHNVLDNNTILQIINFIPGKHFTTISVVNLVEAKYQQIINELKGYSPRNYRAVIGKAIKRFSVETNKIRQISPPDESPARWEKL